MPVTKFNVKKRPRLFFGQPSRLGRVPVSCTGVEGATAAEETRMRAQSQRLRQPSQRFIALQVQQALKKILALIATRSLLSLGLGYRVVGCETLGRVVSEACVCSVCTSPLVVEEDLDQRRGLVSNLSSRATTHSRDLTYIPYLSADWQTFSPNV